MSMAMSGTPVYNLFLALIVLTCVVLVLLLVLLLNHCIKRHDRRTHNSQDLERLSSNTPEEEHPSRPQVQHEHYSEQQRLSQPSNGTITPSIELLPEIRTSSERAEDWLERRDSRFMESDVMKAPKTHRVLGVKSEGALQWEWRSEKLRGGAVVAEKEDKKDDSTEKK